MIARDKQLHLLAGGVIGLSSLLLPWYSAMLLVLLAAVGKETWDKVSGKGTPEVFDMLATIAGGAVVIFILA